MYMLLFLASLLFASGHAVISERIEKATNDFSVGLLKTVFNGGNDPTNTVLSTISVFDVLGILQQGAGGKSLDELSQVLESDPALSRQGYKNLTESLKGNHDPLELQFANELFAGKQFNIETKFRDVTVQDFLSDIQSVDFTQAQPTADVINKWVSDNTNKKIQNMVTPDMITPDVVLMIFNAIFFSGPWKYPFREIRTDSQDFTALDGTVSSVSMMHLKEDLEAQHNPDIAATSVNLPFQGSEFSMVVVVPDEVDGLNNVLNNLEQQQLSSIFGKAELRHVELSLPKFKFDTSASLVSPLQKLGIQDIFTQGADLSGIANDQLYVSNIFQKATIEVDEHGATAAAATGVIIEPPSLPLVENEEILKIEADHSFLFFINDNINRVPLFSGWVAISTYE